MWSTVVAVDWGARSSPWPVGRVANAPWLAVAEAGRRATLLGPAGSGDARNHPTRHVVVDTIVALAERARGPLLVGWDFGFGYPLGFASALGVHGWRGVWRLLEELLVDPPDQRNNRWAVAAELNRRIAGPGPFWGHPPGQVHADLPARAVAIDHDWLPFAERRACEQLVPRTQPVFKLAYPGSVGSQTLLGIWHLQRLRRRLSGRVRIWPFEPPPYDEDEVVCVEAYPTLFTPAGEAHPRAGTAGDVVDANQVLFTVDALARLTPSALAVDELPIQARTEEAWIVGVNPPRSADG